MKAIFSIFFLMCITLTLSAEATFYYADSKKIPLYENTSKAIVKSTTEYTKTLNKVPFIKSLRSISCDSYEITVIEKNDTVTLDGVKMRMPGGSTQAAVYPCYKDENGYDLIPTSYIYVELKSTADYSKLSAVAQRNGCKVLKQNKFLPLWYTLCLSSNTGEDSVEIANRMMETNYFSNAYPAFEIEKSISYDPSVLEQWGLYNSEFEDIDISASEAWNYATGLGVTVAVIDSGVELTHEDLAENLLDSYDAATNTSPSSIYPPWDIHGTHCAGIIGSIRNNDIGIAGVAPDVQLMSISADFDAPDISAQLANGIIWASENGADILSCSWNSNSKSNPIIEQAIDKAIINGRNGNGCIMVFSAGNGLGSVKFPLNYRNEIIGVGNVERSGIWNFFSCTGEGLFICAPGTNILSTIPNNSYYELTGTSMACPHVSGTIALMLERNPALSISQIQEILATTTKKVGHLPYSDVKSYGKWNEYYGYGLIDAAKAVKATPLPLE